MVNWKDFKNWLDREVVIQESSKVKIKPELKSLYERLSEVVLTNFYDSLEATLDDNDNYHLFPSFDKNSDFAEFFPINNCYFGKKTNQQAIEINNYEVIEKLFNDWKLEEFQRWLENYPKKSESSLFEKRRFLDEVNHKFKGSIKKFAHGYGSLDEYDDWFIEWKLVWKWLEQVDLEEKKLIWEAQDWLNEKFPTKESREKVKKLAIDSGENIVLDFCDFIFTTIKGDFDLTDFVNLKRLIIKGQPLLTKVECWENCSEQTFISDCPNLKVLFFSNTQKNKIMGKEVEIKWLKEQLRKVLGDEQYQAQIEANYLKNF